MGYHPGLLGGRRRDDDRPVFEPDPGNNKGPLKDDYELRSTWWDKTKQPHTSRTPV